MNSMGNVMGMPVQEAKQTKLGKITRYAIGGAGMGYAIASMKFNPTGGFAKGVNGVKSWFNTNTPTVAKYAEQAYKGVADVFKNVWGYGINALNSINNSSVVKSIKGSSVYKTVANQVTNGFNLVQNSNVGKWVSKNPVMAIAIGAATLAGLWAAHKSDKA